VLALIDAHGTEMIERIEREAPVDKHFRDLLGGIRCYRTPDEL